MGFSFLFLIDFLTLFLPAGEALVPATQPANTFAGLSHDFGPATTKQQSAKPRAVIASA
jgi:hypothetical protein